MSDGLDAEALRLALEGAPAGGDGDLAAAVERARADVDAIVHGLWLLAAEAPALVTSRRRSSRRPSPGLVVVTAAVLVAGAILGIRDLGPGPIPGQPAGAIRDTFGYAPGSVGVVVSPPGLPYELPQLSSLAFSTATDGWAVGSLHGPFAWHWSDGRWHAAAMPHLGDYAALSAVTAVSRSDAWAVGSQSPPSQQIYATRPLVLHWAGSSWRVATPPRAGAASLYGVSADAAGDVWAVGGHEPPTTTRDRQETALRPLVVHWDGTRWRTLPDPARRLGELDHVVALGPDDVWVASGENRYGRPIVAHWDGSAWTLIAAPFGPRDPIAGFAATSASDAWAVGGYRRAGHTHTLAAHWNGHSWAIVPTPDQNDDSALSDIVAVSPDDVWALGQSAAADSLAVALYEHWNGARWSIAPGVTPAMWEGPTAVGASPDGTAWAIGSCYSDNVATRWNGRTWTVLRAPPDRYWLAPAHHSRGTNCTR